MICRVQSQAYHKFVKTTPNPRATKNRRGELVGLELSSFELLSELDAPGAELAVEDILTRM